MQAVALRTRPSPLRGSPFLILPPLRLCPPPLLQALPPRAPPPSRPSRRGRRRPRPTRPRSRRGPRRPTPRMPTLPGGGASCAEAPRSGRKMRTPTRSDPSPEAWGVVRWLLCPISSFLKVFVCASIILGTPSEGAAIAVSVFECEVSSFHFCLDHPRHPL